MSRSANSTRSFRHRKWSKGDSCWTDAAAAARAAKAPTVAEALAEALQEEAEDRRWYESLVAELSP